MSKKIDALLTETSGSVAVIAAILLVVLCGFGALAIDTGHLFAVKSELQQAADAGALGGARALCTQIPASASFINKPNWSNGSSIATSTVQGNLADGSHLTDADVQAGFWNLSWKANTAPKDATTGAINLLPQTTPPNPLYVPAVRVKVDKSATANSGTVKNPLGAVLGLASTSPSAQSVAAVFPLTGKGISGVPAQSCFPFATPIYWVTQHWNDDPPTSFRIGSHYHDDYGGQWTSFTIDANNVPTVRDLINNGNPTPLSVGDQIWIEPGTKDTLFTDMQVDIGKIGLLPVVPDDYDTHAQTTLLGFAAFYLEDAVGGSSKYIQGHFVKGYIDYDGTPGSVSNYFGASGAAPSLVD